MGRRFVRLRLGGGILAVVILFAVAIAFLWNAASEALGRDRRRAEALKTLALVDDALAIRGAPGLSLVPEWPETLDAEEWTTIDLWLSLESAKALRTFPGASGGFYARASDRFVGYAPANEPPGQPHEFANLPAYEIELIENQVARAVEEDRPLDRLVEMPPVSIAVRASPLRVNGRRVAATWAVIRLEDRGEIDRALVRYKWASGLALAGLLLAMLVTGGLVRTIRRQSIDRKRMEADLRRSERLAALGKLLAGVSHELRNPLAGIRSVAQLWQRKVVTDDELAAELIGEVDRLDAIIGQLLRFSRAEPRTLQACDVNGLCEEAARLARSSDVAGRVNVDLDLQTNLPLVNADPGAILQVLRNLTSNALAMQPTGGGIKISTHHHAGRREVEVRVADRGPGVAPEAIAHLFEPFFTTRAEGTGLGLAIAREIVLAHEGEIAVEANSPQGATFLVRLPEVSGESDE